MKAPLTSVMIASYGRQILEVRTYGESRGREGGREGGSHLFNKDVIFQALLYLYKLGLSPLTHLHTGNIFVTGATCRLGGYENMLLGYRPRLHELLKPLGRDIDIVMFGKLKPVAT